jgi:prevent-host-death family protein
METFSVRDLRERTGELVREAESGRLSLVAKHGHPIFVAVPLDAHLLANGVHVALACKLFAERTVSLGKAAKIAALSVEEFVERLGAVGIDAVDYPPEELDAEARALAR